MAPALKLHKSIPTLDVKVDNAAEGVATAIVSVFGVIDSVNDIIHPGAFTKTIVERGRALRVLDMHNSSSVVNVIGKVMEIHEVDRAGLPQAILDKYPEATGGLSVTIKFALNTPSGRIAFDLLEGGYTNEFSIGFEIMDSDNSTEIRGEKKIRIRNIRTIKLWEVSSVIWGANPATDVVEVRGEGTGEAETPVDPADPLTTREYAGDEMIKRLGDVIHASLVNMVVCRLTEYYAQGCLDTEQYTLFQQYCIAQLNILRSGMPDDVALTPLSGYMSGLYLAQDVDLDTKAGRVLSSTNFSKVTQASALLEEVLASAALEEDTANKADGSTDAEVKTDPVAGPTSPEEPPTMETQRANLQRRMSDFDRRITITNQLGE